MIICLTYGFGYTFQFSQMMKSTSVPRWVLFSLRLKQESRFIRGDFLVFHMIYIKKDKV